VPDLLSIMDPVQEIIDANGKTQFVRLIDVFALGPLMIYVAVKYRVREPQRTALLISGFATILYNGINYVNIRDAAK
jgi:hypothetical protein